MTVTFYGRITEHTNGEKAFSPKIGAMERCNTLRELLDELCSRYGESFRAFINGNETCLILLNGNGVAFSGGLDSPLKQGDKVDILPFVDAG